MYRKLIALAAAPVAVIGIGLATAGAANASATPVATHFSDHLAGYSTIDMGNIKLNDVRSDLTVPNEPNLTSLMDNVATGVVLQESSNSPSPTVGFGLVWEDANASGHFLGPHATPSNTCYDAMTGLLNGSPADQWVLEGGFNPSQDPGTPLVVSTLRTISFTTSEFAGVETSYPMCVPANTQKFYVEIHDSTFHNCIGFDAGAIEPGDNVSPVFDGIQCVPLSQEGPGFFPGMHFGEAGVGVDASTAQNASTLLAGSVFGYWRDGLTQLIDPSNPKSGTNSRLTLDHYDMREYFGTQDGTSSGAPSLTPGPLGVGSAFNVTANT